MTTKITMTKAKYRMTEITTDQGDYHDYKNDNNDNGDYDDQDDNANQVD